MKRLIVALVVCLFTLPVVAMQKWQGYCMTGGQKVSIPGLGQSTTKWMQSYPACTVTVYLTGTSTLATIYADNGITPKSNPFTADSTTGLAFFYASSGVYDVQLSGGGLASPLTLSAIQLSDILYDPVYDIRAFGCLDSSGATDCSTEIQAAITAALTAGKCVFIPSGIWLINTGLTGNVGSTAACIEGIASFGSGASILKYGGSDTALTISNGGAYVYNAKLSHFGILATQNATAGITCDTCSEFILDTLGVVGKSDLTGKFTTAFDLRGSHTPSSNIAHIVNPLCQYNTTCFSLMDVSGIDIFGGDFYQNTQVFLMGSADHVHIHGIMNAEQQDYFVNWDDSLTPSGTILADNVNIEENNILFTGSFGTHNYFLNVKNSGTNRFNLYNSLIQGNRIFCANGACATDYPFHFDISGTTNVNTLLTPVIKNNWLNGASTGAVTSNSAKVVGQFSENQNYGASGTLNVDVAGTVSSWLCLDNNRADQVFTLGCNNRTSGIFASFYNAGDGATDLVIRESGSQGTVAPLTINNSSNAVMAGVDHNGAWFGLGLTILASAGGSTEATIDTGGLGTFNGGITGLNVLPLTAAGGSVGSVTLPFSGVFWGGAANQTGKLGGTFTGNRTFSFPDISGTVPILGLAQTWSALQTFSSGVKAGASGSTISDSRELVQSAHSCGTTTTCANTANGSNRMVFGSVTLAAGSAVVGSITAFTSTSSYVCTGTDKTSAAAVAIANTSTTSITITGTGTDVVDYICVGN